MNILQSYQWYFGGHGDFIDKNNKFPKPGPGGLAQHDNNGFKLLSKIYGSGSKIKPSNLDNINSNNICPIIDSGIYCVKSDTGPNKHNKVSLLFKLENDDNDADYLVNWVNYKGQIKWGFKINKSCKEFKTNSFTSCVLVQKAVIVPRFYFFGKKVKKYRAFMATKWWNLFNLILVSLPSHNNWLDIFITSFLSRIFFETKTYIGNGLSRLQLIFVDVQFLVIVVYLLVILYISFSFDLPTFIFNCPISDAYDQLLLTKSPILPSFKMRPYIPFRYIGVEYVDRK